MATRREFIKQAVAAGVACSLPHTLSAQEKPAKNMIWANLLHLSYNMWGDTVAEKYRDPNMECETCRETRFWVNGYKR